MIKKTIVLIFCVIGFLSASSLTNNSDYSSIRTALNQRDLIFSQVLGNIERDGYPTPETIRSRLSTVSNSSSPWRNLLLAESTDDPSKKKSLYETAIRNSGSNVGQLWGLFIELHKRNERAFQDEILTRIERIQLESGSEELPAISSQLTLLAESEFTHGRADNAEYCLAQIHRFSQNTLNTELTSRLLPGSKTDIFSLLSDLSENAKTSWKTQAHIVQKSIHLVTNLIIVISTFLFFMILVRFYPKAIHPLTCLYPLSVPYRMRIFFTSLFLVVATVFGIYPVIVLLTVLLLRVSMESLDALMIRVVAVLLLLAPLTGIIDSRFNHILSEKSPLILYEKALYGQPSTDLFNTIKVLSVKENIAPKEKALNLTSMALIQYKRHDIANAVALIQEANTLWPTSEQVLMAAGNIFFGYGDTEQAHSIFKNAIEKFPTSGEINYNFGQISLVKAGITDGANYIAKGAALSPRVVNSFIKKNSSFFGDSQWPVFRSFFMGTISTKTFWDTFLLFSTPPTGTIQNYWGATFLGLPVQASLLIVLSLYIISSLIVPTLLHLKKNGECVLCGKPVCRKCRAGDYCNECHGVIQNISNESLVSALKVKISDSKRVGILVKAHLSDILFPGTRDFFLKTKNKRRGYILIPTTFIMYTMASFVASLTFTEFAEFSEKIKLILLAPAILYSSIFIVQNLRSLIPTILKGNK